MSKKNFTISTVATAPDPATTGTSLIVESGHGARFADDEPAIVFPAGEQPDSTNAEVVMITNIATDTLTITRQQESTTARTIVVGDVIIQGITAKDWNDLVSLATGKIAKTTNITALNETGIADGEVAVFNLTNKDIRTSNVLISTDGTLAGNADTNLPTEKAVKTYVDSSSFTWKGAWATSTSYLVNDSVENDGSGYVCTQAHTSGATTEPNVGASWTDYWDLFVEGSDPARAETLTNKTIDGDDNTIQDLAYSSIKSTSRSGSDTTLITGTKGTSGDLSVWNADGDLVGADITVSEILQAVYPIGAIYTSVVSTSPATLFGFGTWAAFGAGKVLVGLDSGDTAFDTVEETGGVKEVTLTSAQSGLPAHTHIQNAHSHTSLASRVRSGTTGTLDGASGTVFSFDTDEPTANATATNQNNTAANASSAHTNLQPYIVVYMWKRTA